MGQVNGKAPCARGPLLGNSIYGDAPARYDLPAMTQDSKTLFITGGTGFLGRHTATSLRAAGFDLRALVRLNSDRRNALEGLGARIIDGDILDPLALDEGLEGAGTVVHLAGIIRERPNEGETFDRIHVEGTKMLAEAAWAAGVKRFIYVSALGTRPDAKSRYHQSKWEAETRLRSSGLEYVVYRPSIIFGPEDDFVNRLARMMAHNPLPIVPVIGQGWNKFQPISVEDMATAIVRAAQGKVAEGTYEMGGPRAYTMIELIEAVKRASGRRRLRVHAPVFVMKGLAPLLTWMMKDPPITPDQLLMMLEHNGAEPNRAAEILERLTPFEEGIRRYLKPS